MNLSSVRFIFLGAVLGVAGADPAPDFWSLVSFLSAPLHNHVLIVKRWGWLEMRALWKQMCYYCKVNSKICKWGNLMTKNNICNWSLPLHSYTFHETPYCSLSRTEIGREKYFNAMSGYFLEFVNDCPLTLYLFLSCKLGVVDTKDCSKWHRKNFLIFLLLSLSGYRIPWPSKRKMSLHYVWHKRQNAVKAMFMLILYFSS